MKIAVIGSGGREHAIAWKLAQSVGWESVYTLPGSDGIPNSHKVAIDDFNAVHDFCTENGIELIVVGPEAPLAAGIVDYFRKTNIKIFGPSKEAARLESSKIYAKLFMQKHGVATADFAQFGRVGESQAFIEKHKGNLVIKYDGLAGGKGVYVCTNVEEAQAAMNELAAQYGDTFPYLIEERLVGDEISIMGLTDGKSMYLLHTSQDHKQLMDGDEGPNTGGMGAICPVPACDDKLLQQILDDAVEPTLKGLTADNFDYKGFIYLGLMITAQGPKVLEYNVRLGDPETEILLPALESDLLEVILSAIDGQLATKEPTFHEGYFVDVVLVSGGYPKSYPKGIEIKGLENLTEEELVFHAGTKKEDGVWKTNGGRVLNLIGRGATPQAAIENAYALTQKISFEGAFYRNDIGQRKAKIIGEV